MGGQLVIGTAMIGLTVGVHVGGIFAIIALLKRYMAAIRDRDPYHPIVAARVITGVVICVFFLHTVEIWFWAVLYVLLKQFESLERALYFSTVTFTALGYGDITLEARWQLLSSLEAANGAILLGVSTAFIFALLLKFFQEAGIVK